MAGEEKVKGVQRTIVRSYKVEGVRGVTLEHGKVRIGSYDYITYKEAALAALAALEAVAELGDLQLMDELLSMVLPTKGGVIDAAAMLERSGPPTDEEIIRGSERYQSSIDAGQLPDNQI